MNVSPTPITVPARLLQPPMLRYGPGSAEATIVGYFVKYWVSADNIPETFQRTMEYVSILRTIITRY